MTLPGKAVMKPSLRQITQMGGVYVTDWKVPASDTVMGLPKPKMRHSPPLTDSISSFLRSRTQLSGIFLHLASGSFL
jgi:hypothetical protein